MITSDTLIKAVKATQSHLPKDCLVVVFAITPSKVGSNVSYISNIERDDAIEMVEGWLKDQYQKRQNDKEKN